MSESTSKFSSLWNDLPSDERARLMPHMIEAQKRHILQCKQKAIAAHRRHMKELNNWVAELDRDLGKLVHTSCTDNGSV